MTIPIMIIETPTVCKLGNWWYITSPSHIHRVHFLGHNLKSICGAELKGNLLIPDTTAATSTLKSWMKGSRCAKCKKILESRKKKAEKETMKALRKAGFQVQLSDIDYLENDGFLPLYVVVYAPVKGLAKEADD